VISAADWLSSARSLADGGEGAGTGCGLGAGVVAPAAVSVNFTPVTTWGLPPLLMISAMYTPAGRAAARVRVERITPSASEAMSLLSKVMVVCRFSV